MIKDLQEAERRREKDYYCKLKKKEESEKKEEQGEELVKNGVSDDLFCVMCDKPNETAVWC